MWVEVRGSVGIAASGRGRRVRVAITLLRHGELNGRWSDGGVGQPNKGWTSLKDKEGAG